MMPLDTMTLMIVLAALTVPPIEDSWLPHTLGGWLAVCVALFALSGLGSVAAVWKILLQPVYRRIEDEGKKRHDAIEKEERERKHDYELLTHNEYGVISRHKSALKADIDNVGTKYNELERSTTDREARVRDLEGRMRESEHDRAGLHKELGATQSDLRSLKESVDDSRIAVIDHIQEAKKEMLAAVNGFGERLGVTERKVAVIDDRQRRGERSERSEVE